MNYYIHAKKDGRVLSVYSLNSSNLLTRVSDTGVSYPLLENINWNKLEPCLEETFNFLKKAFLDNLSNTKKTPKRFKPNTKFNVIIGGQVVLSGWSMRDRQSLSYFLQDMKGKPIEIKDEQGVVSAYLNGDLTEVASYTFFDI